VILEVSGQRSAVSGQRSEEKEGTERFCEGSRNVIVSPDSTLNPIELSG